MDGFFVAVNVGLLSSFFPYDIELINENNYEFINLINKLVIFIAELLIQKLLKI